MSKRFFLLCTPMLAAGLPQAYAQKDAGKKFESRDLRTCDSRKSPTFFSISADQAKQYFICDREKAEKSIAYGEQITLVSDVKVGVGKSRAFNNNFDTYGFAVANGIHPSQTAYPILGSFTQVGCANVRGGTHLSGDLTAPGENCWVTIERNAKRTCFQNSFGDWHCSMQGDETSTVDLTGNLPPTKP